MKVQSQNLKVSWRKSEKGFFSGFFDFKKIMPKWHFKEASRDSIFSPLNVKMSGGFYG